MDGTASSPPASAVSAAGPIVVAEDLTVTFRRRDDEVEAVRGVSFALRPGEVLTILGESGSGKTVTLRALMRLLPEQARVGGTVRIAGRDITALSLAELSRLRGPVVSMVFQEPMTALDPVFTVGEQIAEMVRRHDGLGGRAAMARALELLDMVAIPSAARRLRSYPHEMSGGMRQRAMIALALSCRPSVLLADEPTTALDVTVQIQILLLLRQLQQALGMAMVFVTHDVGVAAEISDRVAVMYAGRFVETGSAEDVLLLRRHPYTAALLESMVQGGMRGRRLETIPGAPPSLAALPPGCAFSPRCRHAEPQCHAALPPPVAFGPETMVRCLRATAVPV